MSIAHFQKIKKELKLGKIKGKQNITQHGTCGKRIFAQIYLKECKNFSPKLRYEMATFSDIIK
jgi:hypothetical protein